MPSSPFCTPQAPNLLRRRTPNHGSQRDPRCNIGILLLGWLVGRISTPDVADALAMRSSGPSFPGPVEEAPQEATREALMGRSCTVARVVVRGSEHQCIAAAPSRGRSRADPAPAGATLAIALPRIEEKLRRFGSQNRGDLFRV